MPGIPMMKPAQRRVHDTNLKAAVAHVSKAAAASRSFHANLMKIQAHSEIVRRAAIGKSAAGASKKNLQSYQIMDVLTADGRAIIKSGVRDLSKAELRRHHKSLAAIIGLMKKNADLAKEVSEHLAGIHRSFSRIVKMYS